MQRQENKPRRAWPWILAALAVLTLLGVLKWRSDRPMRIADAQNLARAEALQAKQELDRQVRESRRQRAIDKWADRMLDE